MRPCGDSVRVARPLFQAESGGSIPTSPLQLEINEIGIKKAKSLNQLWHSRLPIYQTGYLDTTRVCYVAEYDGVYYACAIWGMPSSPSIPYDTWLELKRMAIASDAPKNTASRMIRIMTMLIKKKFPNVVNLISYQDTLSHQGTIYKASGWKVGRYHKGALNIRYKRRSSDPTNLNKTALAPKIRWDKWLNVNQPQNEHLFSPTQPVSKVL